MRASVFLACAACLLFQGATAVTPKKGLAAASLRRVQHKPEAAGVDEEKGKNRYDPYPDSDKFKDTPYVNREGGHTGRIVDKKNETRYDGNENSADWGNEYPHVEERKTGKGEKLVTKRDYQGVRWPDEDGNRPCKKGGKIPCRERSAATSSAIALPGLMLLATAAGLCLRL